MLGRTVSFYRTVYDKCIDTTVIYRATDFFYYQPIWLFVGFPKLINCKSAAGEPKKVEVLLPL